MVSYIIPVYNAEKYLEKCIQSVLKCVGFEDEIILIDDGSTDNSGVICDNYQKNNECIIVKHIKNGGVSKARNLGLKIANQKYIRFIDSDDIAVPVDRVTSADLLIMDAEVLNGQEKTIRKVHLGEAVTSTPKEMLEKINPNSKMCLLHYLWNHLYKSEIIRKYNIQFDENVALGEDFLFNCQYMLHCSQIEYYPILCYKYFVRNSNSENLTKKFHANELERRRKIDKEFIELFEKLGCNDAGKNKVRQLIGGITIGSLESVATKNSRLSISEVKEFLNEFYETEYYEYIMSYIESYSKPGKSEIIEFKFIQRKSYVLLYYYVRLRNCFRILKMGRK